MTKRFGFTLAEVLITLGIIGVVAAMTIPTLIVNTNSAQFKTAYKKAISVLNQGILMNMALSDGTNEDFSTIGDDKDTQTHTGTRLSEILKSRLQGDLDDAYFTNNTNGFTVGDEEDAETPELTYQVSCTGDTGEQLPEGAGTCDTETGQATVTVNMDVPSADNAKAFSMNDNITFIYFTEAHDCTEANAVANKCYGFIDVNGGKLGPNKVISSSAGSEDIYPVIFYGQTVEPASDAARAVLFGK